MMDCEVQILSKVCFYLNGIFLFNFKSDFLKSEKNRDKT